MAIDPLSQLTATAHLCRPTAALLRRRDRDVEEEDLADCCEGSLL